MLLLSLLSACGGPAATEDSALPVCEEPGDERVAVITTLVFAHQSEDGLTSSGFNLDDTVSALGDGTGCGVADYTNAWGEAGVDNGFAKILPALEATEASAVAGLIQDAIDSGALLLVIDVQGLGDTEDDACVDLTVLRATGTPMLGTDGHLEWNQTLLEDTTQPAYSVAGASLSGGRLVASPLPVVLPITVLGVPLEFTLNGGRMELKFNEDGTISGVMGGSVNTDYILSIAENNAVDETVRSLLSGLLAITADMSPDASGTCTEISINFEFTAIPAFLYRE